EFGQLATNLFCNARQLRPNAAQSLLKQEVLLRNVAEITSERLANRWQARTRSLLLLFERLFGTRRLVVANKRAIGDRRNPVLAQLIGANAAAKLHRNLVEIAR